MTTGPINDKDAMIAALQAEIERLRGKSIDDFIEHRAFQSLHAFNLQELARKQTGMQQEIIRLRAELEKCHKCLPVEEVKP